MQDRKELSIDIETYSSVDLSKSGVYKYTEAADFAILLFAYAFDDEPVTVVDLTKDKLPEEVLGAFLTPDIVKCAHNASFERTCINKFFDFKGEYAGHPSHWKCTMVQAATVGLPMALGQVASVLKIDAQKDTEGKKLINKFCKPCKPTKANPDRTRLLPEHAPEDWAKFIEYCRQDVVVEREVRKKIINYPLPDFEQELWVLDQLINDRGVAVNIPFIQNALRIDDEYRARLEAEAIKLTGLSNPNSAAQLKTWLAAELDEDIDTLRKDDVKALLAGTGEQDTVAKRVLEIRQEMSKTSIKKYTSMMKCVCSDGRIRGLFQFCGAGRTWRWAGRLVQVQNLTKNQDLDVMDIDIARNIVLDGDGELLELLYDAGGNPNGKDRYFSTVTDILSQLIRTAFVATEGKRLIVCDAAAIEARIIAWLANEKWRLDVFSTHGKIYEASAAQMFGIDIATIKKGLPNYALRQKGKIAELALGYGGGVGALETMGALKMGLEKKELKPLITAWRKANTAITQFWKDTEFAAIEAARVGGTHTTAHGLVKFYMRGVLLCAELPSGRCLRYMRPKITPVTFVFVLFKATTGQYERGEKYMLKLEIAKRFVEASVAAYDGDPFDKWSLSYESLGENRQWQREYTYGGKLVENITQAVARDCLAVAMTRVNEAGYDIILHVHDEIVMEVPDDFGSLEHVVQIMSAPIPWARGLPLAADGFESAYYKK